ncbi:MAG TPA: DUF2442 domain-containing protein [Dissulfurispiraceae bacterium]|nr:DUF2442 domain-containing protein [Dissulfurispiraceae bacterium]
MSKSTTLGNDTSKAEVTHISANGIWILAGGKELFLPYEDFPWFKDAPVYKILHIEEQRAGHYYWPDLDIDLTDEIIESPERFPLKQNSDNSSF